MLPAIHFIFSRNQCDEAAKAVLAAGTRLTSGAERDRIREIVDARLGCHRSRGSGGARLQHLPRPTRGRRCSTPRRDGSSVQGGGRGMLRRGSRQGGVCNRDVGGGYQHAGQNRGDRKALQVHRRPSRVLDARGVHPADRPSRTPRHGRPRVRGRAVEPIRALRPGRRAGKQPYVPSELRVPPDVQHGRQPGAGRTPANVLTISSTCRSPSIRPMATSCASRHDSIDVRPIWPTCWNERAARTATSTSTGGR